MDSSAMQVPLLQQQEEQEEEQQQHQQQRRVPYLHVSSEPLYEEANGKNSKEQNGDDNNSTYEECDEYNMYNEGDLDDRDDNDSNGTLLSLDQLAVEMRVSVDDLVRALQNSSANTSNDSGLESYPCVTVLTSESINYSGSEVSDPNNSNVSKKSTSRDKRNVSLNNNSNAIDDGGGGGGEEENAVASINNHLSRVNLGKAQLLRFSVDNTTPRTTVEGKGNREIEEHIQEAMGTDGYRGPILFYSSSSSSASHRTHYSLMDSFSRTVNTGPPSSSSGPGSAAAAAAVVLVSTASTSSPSRTRTPTPPIMERSLSSLSHHSNRRIRFGSRIVTNVSVYSVDSEVYLGLHFRQHWSSWVALLFGFLLESLFEVHLTWFANLGSATTNATIPIAHWVYTYRAILSIAYGLAWLPCHHRHLCTNRNVNHNNNNNNNRGVISSSSSSSRRSRITDVLRSYCVKSLSMTFLSSICYSLATAMMILANEISGSSLLFTATVMHSAWILLYRVARRKMIFFIECCGVLLLIIGNVLCNIDSARAMGLRETLYGNILMTGGSILFAAAFLLMAFGLQHQLCSTVGITVAVGIELFLITLIMGICYGYPMSSSSSSSPSSSSSSGGMDNSMNAGFLRANALHAFLLAVEDLLYSLMYLYALFHLDVLSVSASFALKVAIVPIVVHFAVWRHAAAVPRVVRSRWGPRLFAGVAVVAAAAAAVMYFASVRRRFVARRLFHLRGLRPVPDPYRKKTRTRQQRLQQQQQQQQRLQEQQEQYPQQRYIRLASSASMVGVQ